VATIKLNDRFALDTDVQLAPFSALLKYAQSLPSLIVEKADLSRIGGLTLSDPAVTSLTAGLSFNQPVNLGKGAPQLTIQAAVQGSFTVISRSPGNETLFGSDPFGENIQIPEGTCFVATALKASAAASLGGSVDALQFGIETGANITIANYGNFDAGAGSPTLLEALRQSIAGFVIPADAADLAAIPERGLVSITGQWNLKFSGTVNLLAAANPLATLALPAGLPAIAVKAGESVQVGASYQVSGEYQLRVQKVGSSQVRLGWYRNRSTEIKVTASASAGLAAGIGDTDLFSAILKAISSDAHADRDELKRAGLSDTQTAGIQSAVQAAVQRKLELALSFEIGALKSDQAAFLYEVNTAALGDDGRQALPRALAGDLSALTLDGALPAGIRMVRSIFSNMKQRNNTLKINLLGIYNAISISKLALSGSTLFEPATGALVITDKATADRIRASEVNFGADTRKLRHVLAESFLITAMYRGSRLAVTAPALKSSHTFFEIHAATDGNQMRDNVQVGTALGLLAGASALLPDGVDDFGRTTIYAETQYDDALTTTLFLTADGKPRPVEYYDRAGRNAIKLLVREDGDDAFRRRPAIDDNLWRQMRTSGQPQFALMFPAEQVGAITADYSVIVWWAGAMRSAAERLAEMRAFFNTNPQPSPDDRPFQQLRDKLAEELARVAANTKEDFGRPWGLLAMDLASGRQADAVVIITGPRLALSTQRAKGVAAG